MKMSNFFETLLEIMEEKNVSINDLENDNILAPNAFYNFKKYTPSLLNILKIANYLEISLDYLLGNTNVNNFRKYKQTQNIYPKLVELMKINKISQVKICNEVGITRSNFSKWKYGSVPKFSTLIQLAEVIGENIDKFLDFEE